MSFQGSQGLANVKFIHVVAGVYFWEFVLNLDYEYSIITGSRKMSWSVQFYLICRWFTLLGTIMQLMNLNISNGINCGAWAILTYVFYHFAFQSASSLIMLRIYALWKHKRIVFVVLFAIFIAHNMACIYAIAITRAHRNGAFCLDNQLLNHRIVFIASYITDLVLLAFMLFGVFRWKEARLTSGIWWLMYTQGLIYIIVATLVYTPSVIFLLLNLSELMNKMFLVPSTITMSVCALRMHRGLVDSATLNDPVQGVVGTTRPSTIRFARADFRDKNSSNTGSVVLDLQ